MSSFTDSFLSTTDLQKNTKNCFSSLDKVGKKVILSNNKPRAMLLSIKEYERLSKYDSPFPHVTPDEHEIVAIRDLEKKKTLWQNDSITIDDAYFESLK